MFGSTYEDLKSYYKQDRRKEEVLGKVIRALVESIIAAKRRS